MKVIKITSSAGVGTYVLTEPDVANVQSELSQLFEGEIGESLTITLAEMPKEEVEALREFDGF